MEGHALRSCASAGRPLVSGHSRFRAEHTAFGSPAGFNRLRGCTGRNGFWLAPAVPPLPSRRRESQSDEYGGARPPVVGEGLAYRATPLTLLCTCCQPRLCCRVRQPPVLAGAQRRFGFPASAPCLKGVQGVVALAAPDCACTECNNIHRILAVTQMQKRKGMGHWRKPHATTCTCARLQLGCALCGLEMAT